MVTDKVRVRDKYQLVKRVGIVLAVIIVIGLILGTMFMFGFFSGEKTEIVLENPLKDIVLRHTDEAGVVDEVAVVEEGVMEFNGDYINFLLISLNINVLHKNPLTFENPFVELILDDEVWNSEIIKGFPNSQKGGIEMKT